MLRLPLRRLAVVLLAAVLALGSVPGAQAKMSSWDDLLGKSFKGEPEDVLGPFIIFRTPGDGGRRALVRSFSPDTLRKIYAEIAAKPARAASFAEAKGYATGDLATRAMRVQNGKLQPVSLAGEPEPELLLVLCGSHNDGESWQMGQNANPLYSRARRAYPGLLEGIFIGTRHNAIEHREMAEQSWMPWLLVDFNEQRSLAALVRFIPKEGTAMVLVTRNGVPLTGVRASDLVTVRNFEDDMNGILWAIDPANPAGWLDRMTWLNVTRPLAFAAGRSEPVLVGNPLRVSVLRQYGIKRVAARLNVGADGKVTPQILSSADELPPSLVEAIAAALRQAAVAPAIDHGKPVAAELDYVLDVPPADPAHEADLAWIRGANYPTLPLPEWLVLRPIKVNEQDFLSTVEGETASGTVVFKALEVNGAKVSRAAQMSAFNSNWFDAAGADSVRPKAGDKQRIDEKTELTWQVIRSKDGFVDLQTGFPLDYTVGYAWTDVEVPADTDAWLGLGSDDGVKLWHNGELVHDRWIRRQSRVDDDVIPLHLKKGSNRLLLKIQNATIDWSFVCRLRVPPQ